jgi:hypothetical protein
MPLPIKTADDIMRELHAVMKDNNIDMTTGSFANVMSAVVATQCEALYRAMDTTVLSLRSESADEESLLAKGRSIGVYPLKAVTSLYTARILNPQQGVTYATAGKEFRYGSVQYIGVSDAKQPEFTFPLEALRAGMDGNAMVIGTTGVVPGLANVQYEVVIGVRVGRDDESLTEYRRRVTDYELTRPLGGNLNWLKEQLNRYGGLGSYRVSRVATANHAPKIWLYVRGYNDAHPTTQFIVDLDDYLYTRIPVGMLIEVGTAYNLDYNRWNIGYTANPGVNMSAALLQSRILSSARAYLQQVNENLKLGMNSTIEFTDMALKIVSDLYPNLITCTITLTQTNANTVRDRYTLDAHSVASMNDGWYTIGPNP